jgi:hypothetical protein
MTDRIPERIAIGHGRKELDWLRIRTERGIGSSATAMARPIPIIQTRAIAADSAMPRPRTPILVLGQPNKAMVVCRYCPGFNSGGILPRPGSKPKYRPLTGFAIDGFPPYNGAKVVPGMILASLNAAFFEQNQSGGYPREESPAFLDTPGGDEQ